MFTEYFVLFLCALYLIYSLIQRNKYPPSPWGRVPIYGHLPILGKESYKTLKNWKAKYGPMVSLDFGGVKCVAISDVKLIREALTHFNFTGRGMFPGAIGGGKESREGGNRGITVCIGKTWEEQRRFALRNLRDLGFNKLESQIQEEIQELVNNIKNNVGKPISIKVKLNIAVVNSLWKILYGERFDQNDPQLGKIAQLLSDAIIKRNTKRNVFLLYPWMVKNFPKFTGINKITEQFAEISDFIKEKLKIHNENYIKEQPRDFIDLYLDETNNQTNNPNSSFYGKEGYYNLVYSLYDLFIAGSETTSTTLTWMILYLVHYPEIQKKLQNEIKSVVGNSRAPSIDDKQNMPYSEAVIYETLRFSSLAPFGVFRSTLQDCEFNGYKIKKNTTIISNLWSVHFDENIWGDPFNFRPERFLSPDGKTVLKNDNLMPFGGGRRLCLGESLARDELFLFSTTIFQNFKVSHNKSEPLPSLEPQIGTVNLAPYDHELIYNEL